MLGSDTRAVGRFLDVVWRDSINVTRTLAAGHFQFTGLSARANILIAF